MSAPHRTPTVPHRPGRIAALVAGAFAAVALAVTSWFVAFDAASGIVPPYQPSARDGLLTDSVALDDDAPAVANLDPALAEALRGAAGAAAADGIRFEVTSGWRTKRYQEWLLDDAVSTYGSEEAARQYVSTPDRSQHVTGHAVDIGPLDAQLWLIQHGAQWGLCQIYANERWHFEVATTPGGQRPAPLPDAAG